MREIRLSNGGVTIVDDNDFEALSGYRWIQLGGYAVRSEKIDGRPRAIMMHRQILGAPKDREVDHINHARLDNRRGNLRLCTRRQNLHNAGRRCAPTSSQFKGVSWHRRSRMWRASIRDGHRQRSLGYFHNEIDGAIAYDGAAVELFGEFAHINFPALPVYPLRRTMKWWVLK